MLVHLVSTANKCSVGARDSTRSMCLRRDVFLLFLCLFSAAASGFCFELRVLLGMRVLVRAEGSSLVVLLTSFLCRWLSRL